MKNFDSLPKIFGGGYYLGKEERTGYLIASPSRLPKGGLRHIEEVTPRG